MLRRLLGRCCLFLLLGVVPSLSLGSMILVWEDLLGLPPDAVRYEDSSIDELGNSAAAGEIMRPSGGCVVRMFGPDGTVTWTHWETGPGTYRNARVLLEDGQ